MLLGWFLGSFFWRRFSSKFIRDFLVGKSSPLFLQANCDDALKTSPFLFWGLQSLFRTVLLAFRECVHFKNSALETLPSQQKVLPSYRKTANSLFNGWKWWFSSYVSIFSSWFGSSSNWYPKRPWIRGIIWPFRRQSEPPKFGHSLCLLFPSGNNDCIIRDKSKIQQISVGDMLFIKGRGFPQGAKGLVSRFQIHLSNRWKIW